MPRSARIFSRELKLSVIRRMLAGENASALARELQVRRKDLYVWRERFRAGGAAALRGRGRPPKVVATAPAAVDASAVPDDVAAAPRRLAELERKIGQQQLELDFFSASLAASQRAAPAERRAWRHAVYALIE